MSSPILLATISYELLRTEIVEDCVGIRAYETGMYAAVGAILTFTINSPYYFACMIPYLVIISIFFIVISVRRANCKIGTYLYVFHEGGRYNWERRHEKFDNKERKLKWGTYASYYLLSAACSVFTILKLYEAPLQQYNVGHKMVAGLVIIVFTIVTWIVFFIYSHMFYKEKDKMIKDWQDIKKLEAKVKQ